MLSGDHRSSKIKQILDLPIDYFQSKRSIVKVFHIFQVLPYLLELPRSVQKINRLAERSPISEAVGILSTPKRVLFMGLWI